MRQQSLYVILNPWVAQGSGDAMEEVLPAAGSYCSSLPGMKYGSSVSFPEASSFASFDVLAFGLLPQRLSG